ncbi:MAG: ferrous iron transport protein B [Clostridiales bacterium]|jgi:ferrous iron transport protein B|nr:ferrous iron transport protein B [Clostridiales bacterium]
MRIALIGNQNSGKTTLFNILTGANQRVGNFPGVTVEQKLGNLIGAKNVFVIDLPGIYSLSPFTREEVVSRDFLLKEKPDGIINIVDATNIERNLYLTMQLLELNIPMVVAINMMDEMTGAGGSIDVHRLGEMFGVPVAPISAAKNEGIELLTDMIVRCVKNRRTPTHVDFYSGAVRRTLYSAARLIEAHAAAAGIPARFAASKIIEGGDPLPERLNLTENEMDILRHTINKMERETDARSDAALADARYEYIKKVCSESVHKIRETRGQIRSVAIDGILTHRILSLPIFLCVMFLVFWLSFNIVGKFLSSLLAEAISYLTLTVNGALIAMDVNPVMRSLAVDGALRGIGGILAFLPAIAALFFFLSILEDSGYMARVAFVMDRFLRGIGLSGRSFVPLLIGFGCSVPAIMASRTLGSERDKRMTISLIPFISCSAKLPIYAVFIAAFFPAHSAFVMLGLYVAGILLGILYGFLMNKTTYMGKSAPFLMELPPYRVPSAKSARRLIWMKSKDFISRVFTIILLTSIAVWFLRTFDFRLNMTADSGQSMLAVVGKRVAPLFTPLGFTDWRAPTALIVGFTAKEAVVSSLIVLLGEERLTDIFTPLSAASFLIFTLLYTPCAAAVAAAKRELGSAAAALKLVIFQTCTAYAAAMVFYQLARVLC